MIKFIRYADIYKTFVEGDQMFEELLFQNYTSPVILTNERTIKSVSPFIGTNGKQFKNVSIITDYEGNSMKVVGNYKHIGKQLESRTKIVGYNGK